MDNSPQDKPNVNETAAKPRSRRAPPKEAAETGRIWTGERVSVGEGHGPAPAETPSAQAVVPGARPAAPEGEAHWYVVHAYSGHEAKVRDNLMKGVGDIEMTQQTCDVL